MDRIDIETLQAVADCQRHGKVITLVTVIDTWGTAPRPVGAMLAVAADGHFSGSVSGGCIEEDLVKRLTTHPPDRPERATYGVSTEQAVRFGLPCGGSLELLIEPVRDGTWAAEIVAAVTSRVPVVRQLDLGSGQVSLNYTAALAELVCTDTTLQVPFLPPWRIIMTGAGHLSAVTARLARELGYDVYVCDPRAQYRASWPVADVDVSDTMPDDFVRALTPDARTALLALTHDPKIDDLLLLEGFTTDAFYIGALGSERTSNGRRQRLQEHFQVSDAALRKLHAPIGLDLHTRNVPEIALAILAEITALRNGVTRR